MKSARASSNSGVVARPSDAPGTCLNAARDRYQDNQRLGEGTEGPSPHVGQEGEASALTPHSSRPSLPWSRLPTCRRTNPPLHQELPLQATLARGNKEFHKPLLLASVCEFLLCSTLVYYLFLWLKNMGSRSFLFLMLAG